MTVGIIQKCAAEAIGTFWLTFAGCGSAVIAAAFPQVGIGRGFTHLWLERGDDGICYRPYLWMPS
jgi:glycerol uptake facilitator-like aquaporin